MMFKAMILKELLLVLRDKHALAALFVMPAVFILIMSVAMKDSFSNNNIEFTLHIQDADKSSVSKKILSNIEKNRKIHLINQQKNAQFIMTIPKDYEKNLTSKVIIEVRGSLKSNQINIFKEILLEDILSAKLNKMAQNFKEPAPEAAKVLSSLKVSADNVCQVHYNSSKNIPNSTQQSVPAWIVFGMFFIIIPMSTIYVNERKQNTLARLSSMNVSIFSMAIAKSIPYLIINQLQVIIMLGVGHYIVPLLNAPALEINGSLIALGALSLGLSVAAIGISSLIAVSAHSSEQATTIGGILNILLGAIGGVMVPKFIMPPIMQELTQISPMAWGIDGFLDIFLKSANLGAVIGNVIMLMLFGIVFLILSVLVLQNRIKKGI